MLTSRQQKFYESISKLSNPTSKATIQERKYLLIAKQNIESGKEFHSSIDSLGVALQALERMQVGGLNQEVKQLFEDLRNVCGEPIVRDIYGNILIGKKANITKQDQGLAGITALPAKLNGETSKNHPSALRWYSVQIFVYIIPMFVIPVILPQFISKNLSWIILFVYLLVLVIFLIVTEQNKENK